MKILILQTAGKHEKNKYFRECLCLKSSLLLIPGIEIIVTGPGHSNFSNQFLNDTIKFTDVIFILENYSKKQWIPDLSKVNKLKIFWSIDSHCVYPRHLALCIKHKVTLVLNSTSSYVSKWKKDGFQSKWFPNCYSKDLIYPLDIKNKYDVGFCGNILNRAGHLNYLSKFFKLKRDIFIIGSEMVTAINSYKIHFNKNYRNDINYRTFETMGCKTLLLTNDTDRLKDLFEIDRHLVTYTSREDCVNKVRYLLKNPKELNRIAEAGYREVIKNHTYDVRAKELVKIIERWL